jgi:23S rRNA pseudouridine1911/1915/1917 synthase
LRRQPFRASAGSKRPGIVHRLDKDTTGLMVVAKNDARMPRSPRNSHDHAATGDMRRGLPRLCLGGAEPPARHHRCCRSIAIPTRGKKWPCAKAAAKAVTPLGGPRGLQRKTASPSPRCWPANSRPGATHQIRVPLAHIGHPSWAMPSTAPTQTQGRATSGPESQAALTALGPAGAACVFCSFYSTPRTEKFSHWETPLPEDLLLLEKTLRAAL